MVIYALPVAPITVLASPIAVILPGIYARDFGISLAALAVITMAARLFDAIIDPVVGVLADWWRERGGTAAPFLIIGALVTVGATWMLFAPPPIVNATYFAIGIFGFYVGWTLFEIPHTAWAGRLAHEYSDRARIFGVRTFAFYLGSITFFALPLALGIPTLGRDSLAVIAATATPALLVAVVICVIGLHRHRELLERSTSRAAGLLREMITNKPFLIFLGAYILAGISFGMWSGLLFLFLASYLDLGGSVALMFAVSAPAGLLGVMLWTALGTRFGKTRAWAICTGLNALLMAAMSLISPGPLAMLIAGTIMVAVYLVTSGQLLLPNAMLADIADYSRWRSGHDRSATYFAVLVFFVKAVGAFGTGFGLLLADAFGFDPTAPTQGSDAIFGLRITFGLLPALVAALSIPLILASPINARRHDVLRRRLERRSSAAAAKAEPAL